MKPTFLMSLKIYWSLVWRAIPVLFLIFVIDAILNDSVSAFVVAFGLNNLLQGAPNIPPLVHGTLVFLRIVILLSIILYLYRWVLNRLPTIQYKEGQVILMKDTVPIEKYGLFDALCVGWSEIWRGMILQLFITAFMLLMRALFVVLLAVPSTMLVQSYSSYSSFLELSLFWMLISKTTGRWLRLVPRLESTPAADPMPS
jgi:hypothetical protein